jgi:L-threonylcarbamoyladenylate synthase
MKYRSMDTELTSDMMLRIEKGAAVLINGGIIAYPTDTVYGLGASSDNVQAVKRIYKVKKRHMDMPLPLLLADVSWIERVTSSIPEIAYQLIDSFLPGALTLVMKKADTVPDIISSGKSTVALRIPDHPVTIALINDLGKPLIGTSANVSGKPSALNVDEVKNQLGDKIDYILDGGLCPGGKESSIIDVTGNIPVLLREGAVSKADIEKVCKIILPGEEI